MDFESLYEEEEFGVLSSDDLYLDCVLVRPKALKDSQLELLYVWVPRYPLTKTTLINCIADRASSQPAPATNVASSPKLSQSAVSLRRETLVVLFSSTLVWGVMRGRHMGRSRAIRTRRIPNAYPATKSTETG